MTGVWRRFARLWAWLWAWAFGAPKLAGVDGGALDLPRHPPFESAWQAYKTAKALGRGFAPDGVDDSVRAAVDHYVLLGGEVVLHTEIPADLLPPLRFPPQPARLLFAVVRFGEHLTAIAGDEHGRHAWAVPIQIPDPHPKETPRP
jgi:hypothetical protein